MKENLYDPTSVRRPSAFETQISLTTKPEGSLRGSNLRFIVLALISFVSFGASFSTSSAVIAFGYQDSAYSLISYVPYIFIPLIGGAIVDKWSVRGSLGVFGLFVVVGNILLSTAFAQTVSPGQGATPFQWGFGAFLVLFGSGCLIVAQATIAAKWFRNKELALAIGSYLCMSKIGSLLGYPVLFDNYPSNDFNSDFTDGNYSDSDMENIQQTTFGVGIGLSVFSFACIVALFVLDIQADEQDAALSQNQVLQQNIEPGPIGLRNYPLVYHLLICSIFIQGAFVSLDKSFFYELVDSQATSSEAMSEIEFYTYIGIVFALIFPVLGFLVDKFGKRTLYLLVSSIVFTLICVICIITIAGINTLNSASLRVIYIFLDAIFQPIFLCVFWFCLPLVFDQKTMGMGAGIAISTLNLMASINTIIYELLFGQNNSYLNLEVGFYFYYLIYVAVLAFFGSIFSYLLYGEDARTGKRLDNPSTVRIEKEKAYNSGNSQMNSAYL